ncbi:hypothetical protein D3C72_2187310 [compost metagenome]
MPRLFKVDRANRDIEALNLIHLVDCLVDFGVDQHARELVSFMAISVRQVTH